MNNWRTIRYTDDGCHLYECLACKEQWEGRDAPGTYDQWVDTEVLVEGGYSSITADGVAHYYTKRAVPVYVAHWKFCPCCGVEWEGPIRCDIDNPYMYGERRKLAYNCDRGGYSNPDYWYIIMMADHEVGEKTDRRWLVSKVDPREHSIIEVHNHVKRMNSEEETFLKWVGSLPRKMRKTYSIRIIKDNAPEMRSYVRSEYIR